jgi:hypothetical protein
MLKVTTHVARVEDPTLFFQGSAAISFGSGPIGKNVFSNFN